MKSIYRIGFIFIASIFIPMSVYASGDFTYLFATPGCLVEPNEVTVKICTDNFPELGAKISKAFQQMIAEGHAYSKARKRFCNKGLDDLIKETALGKKDIAQLKIISSKFLRLASESQHQGRDRLRMMCDSMPRHFQELKTAEHNFGEYKESPFNFNFVKGIDPEFLREPPKRSNAYYQRDRKIHYLRYHELIKYLLPGEREAYSCLGEKLEKCEEFINSKGYDFNAGKEVKLDNGDIKMTFIGTKVLYKGNYGTNFPMGHEQQIFILHNGVIRDSWQRVQFVETRYYNRPIEKYRCEKPGSEKFVLERCYTMGRRNKK